MSLSILRAGGNFLPALLMNASQYQVSKRINLRRFLIADEKNISPQANICQIGLSSEA